MPALTGTGERQSTGEPCPAQEPQPNPLNEVLNPQALMWLAKLAPLRGISVVVHVGGLRGHVQSHLISFALEEFKHLL
jgi:hypothetical protein